MVFRIALVQAVQQVGHLFRGHRLGAGHGNFQGLVAGGNVLAGLQGQAGAVQCSRSRFLHIRRGKAALVAQGDHGTAGELGIQMDAEHHSAQHDGCHQAGGNGQEALAQAHKIDGLLFCRFLAGLFSAVKPGVAQCLNGSCAADHHTGSKHAKHKVQQHTGEQRIAESIDRTGSGRAKGKEYKVQCLGKQAVRGAEGTHQHNRHDNDGHIAVNDRRQAAGKAALECTVQRLAVLQLFLDALCGDDVGIHTHADGQNNAGDTGQGHGEAFKHREIAGHERQRCRHLTSQCHAGQKARQTVQDGHEYHDQRKCDQTGQHHGAQAVFAQAGADGRVAVHSQRKGQCAGVDLAGHLDDLLLREGIGCRTGDDGRAIGDRSVHGCGAHVLVIQPDADGALGRGQPGGHLAECLGTVVRKLQRDEILRCTPAGHRAILGCSALDHGAVQNQLTVGTAALPEGEVRGGADLVDRRFRVKIRLTGLPRKLEDQAVGGVVHIQLIVGHVQSDQTVLNYKLRGLQLFFGGIVAIRRHKGDVYAALDIHTKADILCALDVGRGRIAVLGIHAEEGSVDEHCDQQHCGDKMPCFAFCFHKIQGTSKSSGTDSRCPYSGTDPPSAGRLSSAGQPSCRLSCDKTPLTAQASRTEEIKSGIVRS